MPNVYYVCVVKRRRTLFVEKSLSPNNMLLIAVDEII